MTDSSTRARRVWSLFRSLWGARRTMLRSRLGPEQCVALLKDDLGGWFTGGHAVVSGRVGRAKAVLTRRIVYGNSFRDVFTVRMQADGQGSRLDCVAGANLYVRIFMAIWFGFLGVWWLGVIVVAITRPSTIVALMLLAPIPMLAFGVGLVAFGRRLTEKDEAVVIGYLKQRLEAS